MIACTDMTMIEYDTGNALQKFLDDCGVAEYYFSDRISSWNVSSCVPKRSV